MNENYYELSKDKIIFHGSNEEEKKKSEIIYDLSTENNMLWNEKQNLIKYLEDKIKEEKKIKNERVFIKDWLSADIHYTRADTYQEILDKIKEGNYE